MHAEHQKSYDGWTPALMDELLTVRSRYTIAFDRLWRDERLMRYVYWLRERAHSDFNMVGSWCDRDIKEEIDLWRSADRQCMTEDDVIDSTRAELQSRYGIGLTNATTLATMPQLASAGYPIWNELTGSLLPGSLGQLSIVSATDYEGEVPGQGVGYSYRSEDVSYRVDICIFSGGEFRLGNGVSDPRVLAEFQSQWRELQQLRRAAEAKDPTQNGPMVETLQDPRDNKFNLISGMFATPTPTGDVMTGLSITAFCDAFLKVRVTFAAVDFEAESVRDSVQQSLNLFNADLAAYCCFFRGRFGDKPY